MSIFILEDHILQAQNLRNTIEEICHKHQLTYDFIEVTSRGEEIIQKIPHTTLIPIYFLDIEIKSEEKKGLEIAQEIRKHDPDWYLLIRLLIKDYLTKNVITYWKNVYFIIKLETKPYNLEMI